MHCGSARGVNIRKFNARRDDLLSDGEAALRSAA